MLLLSKLLLVITLYYFLCNYKKEKKKLKLLTALFSCDRKSYLNLTLYSFFRHIRMYERNINLNFNFIDSGTYDRNHYVKEYKIRNVFYMNPNDPEYAYSLFWSYLHDSFVLFLEDDRPFILDIEKKLDIPYYIEEAIEVLTKTDIVKGITLRKDAIGDTLNKTIITRFGNITLCIMAFTSYYYSNGPAVYRVKELKLAGSFSSEVKMARLFRKRKWYTGFTYKGIKCINNDIYNTNCQGLSYHMGYNISTQPHKRKVCKVSLY